MKPFNVTALPESAFFRYPTPLEFLQHADILTATELEGYLHHQVTEGIPFVFLGNPLLYEVVRAWLAGQLRIHTKDITLIGSARVGFSLSPVPAFGNPYTSKSDLDFTIVSSTIFDGLKGAFEQWKSKYEAGQISPRGEREESYWKDHMVRLPANIKSGFVDSYKIPNRFDASQKINDALWRLSEKLAATDDQFRQRKSSVRVYRSWHEFSRQFMINYRHAVRNVDGNYMALLAAKPGRTSA